MRLHDLRDGGKFKNDFRITSWGAICRKIWLDELPMLMNYFQGDMKLVGVRPLSKQYFELYRKDVQERRIKYKPGLIPPFYADMPCDLDAIQASELKYLDSFDKHPFFTDFSYFWKSAGIYCSGKRGVIKVQREGLFAPLPPYDLASRSVHSVRLPILHTP